MLHLAFLSFIRRPLTRLILLFLIALACALPVFLLQTAGGLLTLEVDDDGNGAAPATDVRGHGLLGMRERATSCGGVLDLGRSELGGWRVRATLPIPAAA